MSDRSDPRSPSAGAPRWQHEATRVLSVAHGFPRPDGCATEAERWTFLMLRVEQERRRHIDVPAVAVVARWYVRGALKTFFRVVPVAPPPRTPEGSDAERVVAPVVLTIGRHHACDVAGIPDTCLRHALLLLWPPAAPGDLPTAELLDLRTPTGVGVGGERAASHVIIAPPAGRVAVGPAEVAVFLAGAGKPFGLVGLDGLGVAFARDVDATPHGGPPPDDNDQCRDESEGMEVTRVLGGAASPAGGGGVVIAATPRELVDGVLLGRYARCRGHRTLARNASVSRVHAALLWRGHRLIVVDTGSTNGTRLVRPGVRRRLGPDCRAAIVDPEDDLELGGVLVSVDVSDQPLHA